MRRKTPSRQASSGLTDLGAGRTAVVVCGGRGAFRRAVVAALDACFPREFACRDAPTLEGLGELLRESENGQDVSVVMYAGVEIDPNALAGAVRGFRSELPRPWEGPLIVVARSDNVGDRYAGVPLLDGIGWSLGLGNSPGCAVLVDPDLSELVTALRTAVGCYQDIWSDLLDRSSLGRLMGMLRELRAMLAKGERDAARELVEALRRVAETLDWLALVPHQEAGSARRLVEQLGRRQRDSIDVESIRETIESLLELSGTPLDLLAGGES